MYFLPAAKQNEAEVWPRFQSFLKLLLSPKGVDWVKVLNALGPSCLWQCLVKYLMLILLLMLSWSTWEYIIGATLYFRSTFALKGQRIVDCSQTMSVLCSPTNSTYSHCSANYPIYPLSLIVTSPLLFFPANLSESQCFQTKHKSRRRKLKKLRWHWCWVRGPANLTPPTLSILPHLEHHCHPLWQVEPAFQIHTLEAWGPAGAPARLPQFDWFVSRWLAVRPNPRHVTFSKWVVFRGLGDTASPCPPLAFSPEKLSASWNHFQLSSRRNIPFVEFANKRTLVELVKAGTTWELWCNFDKKFAGRLQRQLRKKANDSKHGFHQR